MADTTFIKRKIEPYMCRWLKRYVGNGDFKEKSVDLKGGGQFQFDAVSPDRAIVAVFACNRSKTGTGNENTGAVRKVLNDIGYLKEATARRQLLVCTDMGFLELIKKRAKRVGMDKIELIHCKLPRALAVELERTLNLCRAEQLRTV